MAKAFDREMILPIARMGRRPHAKIYEFIGFFVLGSQVPRGAPDLPASQRWTDVRESLRDAATTANLQRRGMRIEGEIGGVVRRWILAPTCRRRPWATGLFDDDGNPILAPDQMADLAAMSILRGFLGVAPMVARLEAALASLAEIEPPIQRLLGEAVEREKILLTTADLLIATGGQRG